MESHRGRSRQGATPLPTASHLQYLWLAYLSRPAADRVLYRTIRRHRVRKILEIGIATPTRTLRMVNLAQRGARVEAVRYVAVDLFEARGDQQALGLSLKEAHRLLKSTAAQVQLIPGDPASALGRAANALQNLDLVVISADHDAESLGDAWFYLPRMLKADSVVYVESRVASGEPTAFTRLSREEILKRANLNRRRRAA
jgi:hypothetical protein